MLSYRCYYLPITAGLTSFILTYKPVYAVLSQWIPDESYRNLCIALLVATTTYIVCRIMDLCCDPSHCHHETPDEVEDEEDEKVEKDDENI